MTVHLVDCSLREGDQAPGVAMTPSEKLHIALLLDEAGVALADAGMPELSARERRFLAEAAERCETMVVGASVRCRPEAVDLAVSCGVGAVFVICPSSRLHLDKRLGTDVEGLLTALSRCAERAGDLSLEVVCEDATRAEPRDLERLIDHAAGLNAARVYLADTVGCRTPTEISRMVRRALEVADGRIEVGIHAHDDLGMATANTVAAVEAGATWPTVCVNGLGERAGNADLASVAVACAVALGLDTGVVLARLPELSRAVESASGHLVAARAPIVGRQVFRHESGIHVDGLLKDPRTYEVVDPAQVGRARELVLGGHSGSAHLRCLLKTMGVDDRVDVDAMVDTLKDRLQHRATSWDRRLLAELRDRRDALLAAQGVSLADFEALVAELSEVPCPAP